MSVVDRARIWWWRRQPQRQRREQVLRGNYQVLLHERARSLEERVHFHLSHLDEYWDRCLGFLDLGLDHDATFVAHDLALCVYIGSEAAAPDLESYSRTHGAGALSEAWRQYTASLRDMGRAHPSALVAVRRSADEFRRVRAAYGRDPHVAV